MTMLQPLQPTATEIGQWETGRANARQQYNQQLAQSQFGRQQANLANQSAMRQYSYNQPIQRRGFDDSWIARGLFRSGLRKRALGEFYTGQGNQLQDIQQEYAGAVGNIDVQDLQAQQARDQYLRNIDTAEAARRADLAAQIKGIA